jgi:hypothetical protein
MYWIHRLIKDATAHSRNLAPERIAHFICISDRIHDAVAYYVAADNAVLFVWRMMRTSFGY